eukprot:TRINITY_DN116277_c0_g1_i1.p1 TRINITY_DN116277_c0_g1~~TRINITY_DN116277_c0_g1_i1.p1  ORF type:complete len:144 (-),score=2.43 TRINITY_DN116277_c0_g1_i1:189-620(-)
MYSLPFSLPMSSGPDIILNPYRVPAEMSQEFPQCVSTRLPLSMRDSSVSDQLEQFLKDGACSETLTIWAMNGGQLHTPEFVKGLGWFGNHAFIGPKKFAGRSVGGVLDRLESIEDSLARVERMLDEAKQQRESAWWFQRPFIP